MEVVANNYLPGDQRLVDKIVYELKSQGIFDQFRKECFADVDTKPAYQNLRQRVEGSVTGFLKEQSWRPDMNKNQVREMLRRTITESGYLETGVERIVDQVVNPKINTVFLPKVEEVVYSFLGIQKPNRADEKQSGKNDSQSDLLPTDLEAVSPESEPIDKKEDKSNDNMQDLDESKMEEDESPPFEPLEEQSSYIPQEENSVDSHLSGFSGLISHESNQSNDNKTSHMDFIHQDSQMSRNSSDSRLSIVTSDENSKMDICEDSQSKSVKSGDSNHKTDEKKEDRNKSDKHKSSDRHKSRSESKSDRKDDKDKERKSSKDSRSKHSSSYKDKSRDRKDPKSSSSKSDKDSSKTDKDKDKSKEKDRSKTSSNSSSKHGSNSGSSKDKSARKDSVSSSKDKSDRDKDRNRSSSSHRDKDSKKEKSSDSKSKEKSSSSDKHKRDERHSSHGDRHSSSKKDKDRKKDSKSKDDHYSSKDKKTDRRSTDRDSNDGQSSKQNFSSSFTENSSSQSQKTNQESSAPNNSNGDSGNSDQVEKVTRAPVIISESIENSEVTISPLREIQKFKVMKPKVASNIQEALRLMKIRKQLAELEKQNQLSLASVNVDTSTLVSSSINLEDLNQNGFESDGEIRGKMSQEDLNSRMLSDLELVPSPLQNTVISQDNWDAMEEKLRKEVCTEFNEFDEDVVEFEDDYRGYVREKRNSGTEIEEGEGCKYFEKVDTKKNEFLQFVNEYIRITDLKKVPCDVKSSLKRKLVGNDLKVNHNNNRTNLVILPEKRKKIIAKKNKEKIHDHVDVLPNQNFPLPLSPAESDKSVDKKEESTVPPKQKRVSTNKAVSNQRYSSDDLYKPRPTFISSRRRGAKNSEN